MSMRAPAGTVGGQGASQDQGILWQQPADVQAVDRHPQIATEDWLRQLQHDHQQQQLAAAPASDGGPAGMALRADATSGGAPLMRTGAGEAVPAGEQQQQAPSSAAAMQAQQQHQMLLQLRQHVATQQQQQQAPLQSQQQLSGAANVESQLRLLQQQQQQVLPRLTVHVNQRPTALLEQPQTLSEMQHGSARQVSLQLPAQQQQDKYVGPFLEVEADMLEKEGDRVVSALNGGCMERAWALNLLCLLSLRQEIRLSNTPNLLASLLPVLQEGLAVAVGLSTDAGPSASASNRDDQLQAQGLPPEQGWQQRQAERRFLSLFPDQGRLEERLQEAAAAAVVLRNVAEVQQNSALLLDPPVMRCWTWALDAARELVQQQAGDSGCGRSVGDGTAADICTTLLQMATVLSSRMLLPAFFECGMLLLRSLLILLRPSWQHSATTANGAVLPPPLVALAALAVTSVATAYQPNTDILLSMTGAPGGGQPGATLMQVVSDLLVCPFDVFRQHAQQQVDNESPDWRLLLPTDAELLQESKRSSRVAAGARALGGNAGAAAESSWVNATSERSTAELCTLDMMAVLSQLRYLSALLHLLWRLLTAAGPAGTHARAAAAACPRLLSTLCEIAVHRWPQHPVRWHADGHTLRHPDAYPAYLRFLSVDMMPAMRERQDLLQPLRADAAALLALLAADPETRQSVAWCEGRLVTAVMSGTVPSTEPGISALLARFAAQGASTSSAGNKGLGAQTAGILQPPPSLSSQGQSGAN